MDYKKFLKKTSIVLSAVLLALQIGMQSASAFTVAQSATNTNGINVNVKQIKEIANVDFSVSNSTPSQSLAQTVTTLVSHDSVGPNGNLSISANASTVLKYLYPNYTDAQLQGATITPDQAVQWLHSVGYTANIINRPLNTTEIKSYLDKSEPIVTVLANQNPSDWITQSYSGVLYAHDDVDAGTQHLHESFIKSTYFGEATIQDGAEAQSFTFPSQTNSTDPIERADSYKWVSTIVDIKQDPSWTNSHSIMASKATGVFASKLSTSGTQSELDFTDPTITALYNKYPQTNTDPTTKLAAVSLINLYEDATHQKTVTDLNNYLKVTAASYVTPAQIESWYQYLGFDFDVLNGKAPMATTKAINNSGRLYITFYNASLATNPIKNIAMIGAGYTHNSFGGYMPRLTPVKAWQQIQTSYAYYGSTAADFQKDLADMQVYKYAKIQLGLGQYAETNGGIYTENSTIYNIRVKGTPDSAEVTTAPAPTSVKTVIPVSNVKPVTNASYIASPNFLIRETQGQQPWCSEFVNAAAINDVLKATAAASTITAQSIIQSIYPTTAPATLPTLSGGTIQNALKVIQAKYGVTADVIERPLTFVEVKSQIDAGNIVQMDGNDSATTTAAGTPDNPGHSVAIIGYVLPTNGAGAPYYRVWNPWWNTSFYLSSTASTYNLGGVNYKWNQTWYNWRKSATAGTVDNSALNQPVKKDIAQKNIEKEIKQNTISSTLNSLSLINKSSVNQLPNNFSGKIPNYPNTQATGIFTPSLNQDAKTYEFNGPGDLLYDPYISHSSFSDTLSSDRKQMMIQIDIARAIGDNRTDNGVGQFKSDLQLASKDQIALTKNGFGFLTAAGIASMVVIFNFLGGASAAAAAISLNPVVKKTIEAIAALSGVGLTVADLAYAYYDYRSDITQLQKDFVQALNEEQGF